ncbi:YhdP family protein [Aliidiomarina soli]|uniref:TIGR02099 family protein n=1 Tax=Aliidiomarina soli TaxID=1928574 RepID=A0A432WJM4_9GAMM|nr:YhdP family protein [Aliidiomarina soli]RUO34016.1 TIGR02099 family protein [Aliidiomarina soli]
MVRRILHFTVRKLWLMLAILLVLAAVILSGVRYSLPYLDHYRSDIESLIEERYGQRVEIGALAADWSTFGPSLVLQDVSVTVDQAQPFTLHVGRTHLVVNLWQSLWNWQWQLDDFVLEGVNVDYLIDFSDPGSGELPLLDALEGLLLEQLEQFQVVESQINLRNQEGSGRTLYIEQLSWVNRVDRRQGRGRVRVSDVTADNLNFILDVEGDHFLTMRGELYLQAEQLDMSPWLEAVIAGVDISRAELNVRAWFDFDQGRLGNGQVHFGENVLQWQRDGRDHQLVSSPVTWGIWPQDNGWLMNSEPLTFRVDDSEWPVDSVRWHFQDGEHTWNLHNLVFSDTAPLWSLFGSPGAQIRDWFAGIKPAGVVNDVQVRLSPALEWSFFASADNIRWQSHRGVPGLQGLSFDFWSDLKRGAYRLSGDNVALVSPATFSNTQQLSRIHWQGYWERLNDGWRVALPEGRVRLADVEFNQQFTLTREGVDVPTVEWWLSGDGAQLAVADALELLPLQLGQRLTDYLREAIVDGEVNKMSLLWRGALETFPYYQNDGVFLASLQASPLDFRFRPEWPMVTDTAMTIEFRDHALRMLAEGGSLGGTEVLEVDAQITDLMLPQRWLRINAKARSTGVAARELFMDSPLQKTVGAALQRLHSEDSFDGEVELQIPLFAAAQDQSEDPRIRVAGHVDFSGQQLLIEPIGMTLKNLDGRFNFDDDHLDAESVTAEVYNLPLQLSLAGAPFEQEADKGYGLDVTVAGEWPAEFIHRQLDAQWLDEFVDGDVRSDANLALRFIDDGFSYRWAMRTMLDQLTMDLPAPLGAERAAGDYFDFTIRGDHEQMMVTALWPSLLRFEGALPLGEKTFSRALVELGETPERGPALSDEGLALYLDLDELDVSSWLAIRNALLAAPQGADEGAGIAWRLPALNQLSGRIQQLSLLGQQLEDVQLSGRTEDEGLSFDLISDSGRVAMMLPHDPQQPIAVRADYLSLQKVENNNSESSSVDLTPAGDVFDQLPAIHLVCQLCRYDEKEIGRIEATIDPSYEGEQLRNLNIRRSGAEVDMTGGWQKGDTGYVSRVQGWVAVNDIGNLFADFGVSSVVRDSSTQLEFDLHWDGSPAEFNKQSLSGAIDWELGSGYLRDVSDGGARLFSLFSLESLMRKLTLDFRDIFARGMFYSSFRGTLTIDEGIVYTDNTRMNGSAGDMDVRGSTNLVSEALDYQLVYVPKVTSSLPVLVAWMVNPPTGIAALLIDRVLHDAQVISRLEYSITGTVSQPVVNEEARDQMDVDIPDIEFEQSTENEDDPS